jgi:hypothetical protein
MTILLNHLFFKFKSLVSLSQRFKSVIELKKCYTNFKCSGKVEFMQLVTSSFPSEKELKVLVNELNNSRFYDLFQINVKTKETICYMCAHPARAIDLLSNDKILLQGTLKEKHGKLKIFKRWKKRLYSLTPENIIYLKKDMRQEVLSVRYIKYIVPSKSKADQKITKTFEIYTDANNFVLKAKNSHDADQWLHYLYLTKACEMSKFICENTEDSKPQRLILY